MNAPLFLRPPIAIVPRPGCDDELRSLRPLENTPDFLTSHGRDICIEPGAANAEHAEVIFDTRVRCAIGEILAIIFSVDACNGESFDPCRGLDPRDPIVLLRARVTGGLGCMKSVITFDIRHGTVFAMSTSSVKVEVYAVVVAPPGINPSEVFCPPPIMVSAGVGYGCGREYARLTEPVRVPAGSSGRVPLPAYASRFALVPSGTSSLRAQVIVGGSGPYPTYEVAAPTPDPHWFPLVNGARCLTVDGGAAGAAAEGFVLFGLDL